jgi:hypothetical protein
MSTTDMALTAHLVLPSGGKMGAIISLAYRQLRAKDGIWDANLQVKRGMATHSCDSALPGSV